MSEVVQLRPQPARGPTPEEVLEVALDQGLKDVIVIGIKKDGTDFIASTGHDRRAIASRCLYAGVKLVQEGP